MPWHNIPDVNDGDVLTAADLQLYLDNINYLHAPLVASYFETNDAANFTTTSTTWAALTSNYQLSLVTQGERVMVLASLSANLAQFDVSVDGTRLGGTPATTGPGSFGQSGTTTEAWTYPFVTLLDLAAGTHTFDLMWKAVSGTATVNTALKPWFMVRALHL